ncbi:TonB-dependent receptor [Mucilaginibacter paludis]|uniref:TonB-dependent receptor plug n=1 Tax=Mucilaginibacter paludis DSM 18603 TaxID=714943 RepID=H1YC22_9SPHI|nr:TonB-dependent receptor [Mucilaginibacter paludis]EHQ29585.1 TonB-dependent receptor plug [Mucilaginibacter paludis DSM 18603]
MKCSFIVISVQLIFMSMLLASNVKSQNLDQKINLRLQNVSVAQGLSIIGEQSNTLFSFREQSLQDNLKKVTLLADGITVKQAIEQLLSNTNLDYKIVKGYIVVDIKAVPLNITGIVVDENSKETLIGVSIRLKNGLLATLTDVNGRFRIKVPEEGAVLVVSYIGYQTKEIKIDAAHKELSINLKRSSTQLSEVTVQARKRVNTEVAVLEERKNAAIIQDGISAQQIERTGSITTTQALQKVTGVTVTDDRYVAIRGLGDRSVIGELNGARLSSSDPDRSAIPLDLVPAALLENITIYKTVTPDKPADASAGIIELKTKSVPDAEIFEVTAQSGLNSNIGINGNYHSFTNSDMGPFGTRINNKNLSNDFKALATQYPGGVDQIQGVIANSNHTNGGNQEVARINTIMQGFDPVLTTHQIAAPLNQLYTISYGNSYNVFKKHTLGVILAGNYYSRTTEISNGDLTQYSIYQGVITGNPDVYSPRNIPNYITPNNLNLGKYQTYKENTGVQTLNYGVLGGLTYRFSPRHEISMQYLGSWGGETEATSLNGSYDYAALPGTVGSTVYSLKQTYRTLNTFDLQGEHKFFNGEYSPRLSYNASTSKSTQNNPDYRFVNLIDYMPRAGGIVNSVYTAHLYALASGYVNGFGAFGTIQADPNGRRWRTLDETNYNYKADLSIPFKLLGLHQEFKTGVNYLFRKRDYSENVLFLPGSNYTPGAQSPLYYTEGNLDRLVSNDIIGTKPIPAGQSEGAAPIPGFLYNSQKSPNNYKGYYETNALYAMLDFKVTKKLRLSGGVRFEVTNIGSSVDTSGVFIDPKVTNLPPVFINPNANYKTQYDPYYSANATYTLNGDMNFRAAFNTTLARPELRELTNVFEFDAFQGGLVVGNPKLVNQSGKSLDFRWEWFPDKGEVFAVSVFGKQIKNQLIKVFNLKTNGLAATYPEFPTIQFQNDPNTGKVYGIELEVVKNLGNLWDRLHNIFLGSNLLLAQSDIKKSTERYEANRSLDRYTPKNSPLFEQAPYSINAWINYNNTRSGTDLTVTFNEIGERLVQINLTGEPDLYTQPVPVLDFIFSQRLTKRLLFKGYTKNILNPAVKTVYADPNTGGKWYGNEYINRSYHKGSEIMFGFTYKLY